MANNQKTTNFTNISDIVRANRENRLGKTVKQGVSKVVGQGQQQLQGAQQQFQQGAQQGQIGTAADQAYVQQTIQNPMNVQQQDIDRFANLRSGQYKGPTQLGNREELGARGQELQGIGQAASTEQGRRGLLQRFVAPQQQYTQGQQRLDNLLLGQTGGQATRQARQQAGAYNQQLIDADRAARQQGQAYTQQAQQFGQQVGQQLQGAQTAQQQELQNRVLEQQKRAEAARAAFQSLLSRSQEKQPTGDFSTMPVGGINAYPTITQEQYDLIAPLIEQAGLNETVYGPEYFAGTPETIVGQGVDTATLQNVASDQDKARALALAKLSGQTPTLFQEGTQVGGYDPLSFLNRDRFKQALSQSKKQYEEASPYASLMDKDTNLAQVDFLGSQYRPYATQQASAIEDLANQLQGRNPEQAEQYRRLAGQLEAWGGGRGYLFGGDEGQYFKNLYNQALARSGELESAYPGGSEAVRRSVPVSLLERLRGRIGNS